MVPDPLASTERRAAASSVPRPLSRFPRTAVVLSSVGPALWLWESLAGPVLHGFGAVVVITLFYWIGGLVLVALAFGVVLEVVGDPRSLTRMGVGIQAAVVGLALLLFIGLSLLVLWLFTSGPSDRIPVLIYSLYAGVGLLLAGVFLHGIRVTRNGVTDGDG